jgi:hypothetical protein
MHFGLVGADMWLEHLAGWFYSSVLVAALGGWGHLGFGPGCPSRGSGRARGGCSDFALC